MHCSSSVLYLKAFRSTPSNVVTTAATLQVAIAVTSTAWSLWAAGSERFGEVCILEENRKIVITLIRTLIVSQVPGGELCI